MEQIDDATELLARRERVASFIRDNLRPAKQLLDLGGLADFDEDVRIEAEEFEVRDHQLDAWAALWYARQAGADMALVHLATGLGKTSVAVFDVIKFREEFKTKHGRESRILFTSHKNEINEQAGERFAAFIPDASQGFYNGEEKAKDADLTFATLQSLYASLDTFEPGSFDYIVYDEAHHNKADTFEAVVKHFKPAFQLALTATPNRMDELDIRELFGHEVYSKGLAKALAEDLLATPDYHIVFDEAVRKAIESGFEPESLKELHELFSVSTRNEIIAEQIKAEVSKLGFKFGEVKTIVFCNDIAHAEEMARLLDGTAYHSGIKPKKKRRDILAAFKEGDLQTLTTKDMLSEGVDVPDARLIVFLRSTSSQTVFEQQLGRGLRKKAGKDVVTVLDFAANIERIVMVYELAKSVREHAVNRSSTHENGAGVIDETLRGNTSESGFSVHTSSGNFDFDRLSVDLLAKFNYLKSQIGVFSEYSNEEISALALSLQPDKPLAQKDIQTASKEGRFPSLNQIIRRFGTLTAFQRACGFTVKESTVDWSKVTNDELLIVAMDLNKQSPLTHKRINELSQAGLFLSPPTIASRFGSMRNFRELCGIEGRDVTAKEIMTSKLTNDEIIELALNLQDKPLSRTQIEKLSQAGKFVSASTIYARFGSTIEFQRACGFDVKDFTQMSNEEIIELARGLKGGPLTYKEVKELSKAGQFISTTTIVKRFGSLDEFRRLCGY